MTQEIFDEEKEEKADKDRDEAVIKALDDMVKRYKALFDNEPDMNLTPAEIWDKIRTEMIRRNLRPYKL